MKAKKLISVLLALLLVLPTVGVLAPSKASAAMPPGNEAELRAALATPSNTNVALHPTKNDKPIVNFPVIESELPVLLTKGTIQPKGKNISSKGNMFILKNGTKVQFLSMNGQGNLTAGTESSEDGSVIVAETGAEADVYSGVYSSKNGKPVLRSEGGTIVLKGATIKGSGTQVLQAESGLIKLKAGRFEGFDPRTLEGYAETGDSGIILEEGSTVLKLNENVYTVGKNEVAKVFDSENNLVGKCHTLYDAVDIVPAGGTIKLIKPSGSSNDVIKGVGIKADETKDFTLDLNGLSYQVTRDTVGSPTTEVEGFQFLKGSNITIKNGKLIGQNPQHHLINSYGTLILDNVTLDGNGLKGEAITLMAANGEVVFKNGSKSYQKDGDEYQSIKVFGIQNSYPNGVKVTIEDTCDAADFGQIGLHNRGFDEQGYQDNVIVAASANFNDDLSLTAKTEDNYDWIDYKPGYKRLAKTTLERIAYTSLEANGEAGETDTDTLTVTFDSPVSDLTDENFNVEGATIESVSTEDDGLNYVIKITNLNKENGEKLTVGVSKDGTNFAPVEREVTVHKSVDRDALKESIDKANDAKDTVKYENASSDKKKAFDKALKEANNVYKDKTATQDDVDAAKEALDKAREALDGKKSSGGSSGSSGSSDSSEPSKDSASQADKDGLQDAVDGLENDLNNGTVYTDESVKRAEDAINEAKDVLADKKATQEDLDKALEKLNHAERAMRLDVALDTIHHYAFMFGYPDGTFGGDRTMTRAEVAAMFSRIMLDKPEEDMIYPSDFSDVYADDWYADVIGYMSSKGLLAGYPDGTFRPNAPITRAEFAALANRFATIGNVTGTSFADTEGHWAADVIEKASAVGWVGGYEGNIFKPDGNITRAEAAAIANRMMYRSADRPFVDSHEQDMNKFADLNDGYWAYNDIMEATNGHEYDFDLSNLKESWEELNGKSF